MIYGHQTIDNPDGSITYDYYYKNSSLPVWKEISRLGMFLYLHPTTLTAGPDGLYNDAVHTPESDDASTPFERLLSPSWGDDEASSVVDAEDVRVTAYDPNGTQADVPGSCEPFDTGAGYGFNVQVAQVASNLVYHGVLDAVPDLRIVLGHDGEGIAFSLWRIDSRASPKAGCGMPSLKYNSFSEYFRKNFYVTTSGYFDTPSLLHLMSVLPHDRILFSIDSFAENVMDALDWYRNISVTNPEISCELLQKIAYKNAEVLLGDEV